MNTRSDTFTFYKDRNKEWRWNRIAGNGRIVGASAEGYKNKADCIENAIRNGYDSRIHTTKFED
ncbi:DUF1508 domain-containing protein [Parabacteroides sp. OttesenSCG-928-G07]|nr:DUF1508 domain-containing protein [Parabacteroides sp. OttesenSCG-928-G07]